MADSNGSADRLLQRETRSDLARISEQHWVTVYSSSHTDDANGGRFCALVPEDRLAKVLDHASWDLTVDGGTPGFSQRRDENGAWVTTYHRFGSDDGVEPLVFRRTFHGLKPVHFELAEEFRHFHNLYYDRHNDKYVRMDEGGEEEVVAEVIDGEFRIRTRRLRQFLAARRMHLAVFFDLVVYSTLKLDDVPPEERAVEHATRALRYTFHVANDIGTRGRTLSRLLGKATIAPLPLEQSGIWPYEERVREYAAYVIGVDKEGKDVLASCDPDGLSNYFGKNEGAPHFLTPVVFRREVLKKYYDNEKYSVEDGYLHCGSLWGLRMDNHGEDVTVFLGDLGQSLTHTEQLYWKSFNKTPRGDGKDLSETAFKRGFLAEFADPSAPDLLFKSKLTHFIEEWEKKFGWHLFRPVREDDAHVY